MKNKSENRKYIHTDILDKLTSERIPNESHWIGVNRKKGGRWNWQTGNFRTISFMLRIWIIDLILVLSKILNFWQIYFI